MHVLATNRLSRVETTNSASTKATNGASSVEKKFHLNTGFRKSSIAALKSMGVTIKTADIWRVEVSVAAVIAMAKKTIEPNAIVTILVYEKIPKTDAAGRTSQ